MKTITFLFSFFTLAAAAQQLTPAHPVWKAIEGKNKIMAEAYTSENLPAMKKLYMDSATLMPEHSKMRHGVDAITDFYKQWFDAVTVEEYQRSVFEVIDMDGYALEIGVFTQTYTLNSGQPYEYSGKYMVVWRTSPKLDTAPFITAELYGANATFDDAMLPQIDDTGITAIRQSAFDKELAEEVGGRNAVIGRLVTERKGAEHATLFMDDAIYMTYYTPMLIGKKQITNYFTEHEKPGQVTIDKLSLNTADVFETAGDPVIEYGYYSVDFTSGDYKGNVQGKSINVWKRNEDGTLMLFRQAVNHD